jgi:hypothetical protein
MKKGIGVTQLLGILVILGSAIVIFFFLSKVVLTILSGGPGDERQVCKTSLLAESYGNRVGNDLIKNKCKTYRVTFFEDRVEVNGKKKKVYDDSRGNYVTSFSSLNDVIVNRVVAEELRMCWWQFWEGKMSTGTTYSVPVLGNLADGDSCFICSEISFDSSVSKDSYLNFYNYTKNTKMINSDKTYYQYYAEAPRIYDPDYEGGSYPNIWEHFRTETEVLFNRRDEIPAEIVFEKGKTYAVYLDYEGQSWGWSLPDRADKSNLKSTQTLFAYVIESSKLADTKYCDTVNRGEI